LIEIPVWGWAIIGLGAAATIVGIVSLWNRLQLLVNEGRKSEASKRWWWKLFKNHATEEENPDQRYIATLLEDIENKQILN